MLKEPRVRFALVVVLVALGGGTIVAAVRQSHGSSETPITITTPASTLQASNDSPAAANATSPAMPGEQIAVHITGAVKSPNLYQLSTDSRLADAIKIAGGAKADADLDAVNLAEKLRDGEKVYIPTRADTKAIPPMANAAPQNSIGDKTVADEVTTDPASTMSGSDGTTPPAKTKKGSGSKSNKLTNPSQGTVNINTASAADLMRLPGVGKTTAARIIAYRTTTPFKKPEDIMNVSGIGPKKFAKMQPFIRVS